MRPALIASAWFVLAKTNQALAIKAGLVDGHVLPPAELKVLSELPTKDAIRARVIGAIQGPLAQLVGLLQASQRDLAYVLAERGKNAPAPTGEPQA